MTDPDEHDFLFHRFVDPASKKDAPRENWPWPSMNVFKVGSDGVSFDDGRTWGPSEIRAHLACMPMANDLSKMRDPTRYGLTAISRDRLSKHFKKSYKVKRKPTKAVGNLPANPAHALVVPPNGHHDTLVRSDLWTISQGYDPPPILEISDSEWKRWEDIAFKRIAK